MLCQNLFQRKNLSGWILKNLFSLDKYDDNKSRGCVLEIDLEYNKELHESHK